MPMLTIIGGLLILGKATTKMAAMIYKKRVN
jgi:hypothetical protein